MIRLLRLLRDESAAAATEMALVAPMLLALMFGAFELGYYFMSEHVVQKAVRDAARYAARLPMTDTTGTVNYNCSTDQVSSSAETKIQEVARFQDPTGAADGATARLAGWTSDLMTSVKLTCITDTSNSYVNNGVYAGFPDSGAVPVITVTAAVPYTTLFGAIGLGSLSYTLNAMSQAAVIGA